MQKDVSSLILTEVGLVVLIADGALSKEIMWRPSYSLGQSMVIVGPWLRKPTLAFIVLGVL